jgi:hypothetical protein
MILPITRWRLVACSTGLGCTEQRVLAGPRLAGRREPGRPLVGQFPHRAPQHVGHACHVRGRVAVLVVPGAHPAARGAHPKGALVLNGVGSPGRVFGPVAGIMRAVVAGAFVSHRLRPLPSRQNREELLAVTGLIEDRKLMPVVDRSRRRRPRWPPRAPSPSSSLPSCHDSEPVSHRAIWRKGPYTGILRLDGRHLVKQLPGQPQGGRTWQRVVCHLGQDQPGQILVTLLTNVAR